MNSLQVVEQNNKRVLLTSQIAQQYGATVTNIKQNFNNHAYRFHEGQHYFVLEGEKLKVFKNQVDNIDLVPKHTAKLYLWTERGALRHAKILDTDKAWDVYEQLEETYFQVKRNTISTQNLSPELQMFNQMFTALANIELSQQEAKKELQDMREVISLDSTSWREDSKNLIVKAAHNLGGNQYIKEIRAEIYKALNNNMGCDLKRRLTNMRRRMADEGVSRSKRDKLNYLDVIAQDKKLIDGYVHLVKQVAIKYGVRKDEVAI